MKTIVDVITESMNDYGNDFKECETLEQFICKFLAINDLDDFNKYLYSELEDNGDCIPFDQGDFKSTKRWIESYKNAQLRDVRVKYGRTMDVISCKVANKRYEFNIQK